MARRLAEMEGRREISWVSLLHSTTSSVTKAVALLHPTIDADYCYSLGYTAALPDRRRQDGLYVVRTQHDQLRPSEWIAGGVPVTMMMNMERRHGEMKPVIQKALVQPRWRSFQEISPLHRDEWAMTTSYVYPGPIQYFGPTEVCDEPTKTLQLEQAQ